MKSTSSFPDLRNLKEPTKTLLQQYFWNVSKLVLQDETLARFTNVRRGSLWDKTLEHTTGAFLFRYCLLIILIN